MSIIKYNDYSSHTRNNKTLLIDDFSKYLRTARGFVVKKDITAGYGIAAGGIYSGANEFVNTSAGLFYVATDKKVYKVVGGTATHLVTLSKNTDLNVVVCNDGEQEGYYITDGTVAYFYKNGHATSMTVVGKWACFIFDRLFILSDSSVYYSVLLNPRSFSASDGGGELVLDKKMGTAGKIVECDGAVYIIFAKGISKLSVNNDGGFVCQNVYTPDFSISCETAYSLGKRLYFCDSYAVWYLSGDKVYDADFRFSEQISAYNVKAVTCDGRYFISGMTAVDGVATYVFEPDGGCSRVNEDIYEINGQTFSDSSHTVYGIPTKSQGITGLFQSVTTDLGSVDKKFIKSVYIKPIVGGTFVINLDGTDVHYNMTAGKNVIKVNRSCKTLSFKINSVILNQKIDWLKISYKS